MKRKELVLGALLFALGGGAFAIAAGGSSMACPMRVPGAEVKVVKIDSGVVIHVTSGDAATAARIRAAAEGTAGHSGCKHCPGHGAAAPAEAGGKEAAVYACSMGDYSGPQTKDGRCPKCGMKLSLKK